MRVLMLGWEFPPYITGGLGTACFGLTRALSRHDHQITFVLPKAVDDEYTEHVRLLTPQARQAAEGDRSPESVASTFEPPEAEQPKPELEHVTFKAVPSKLRSPYPEGHEFYDGPPQGVGFIHPTANIPQTDPAADGQTPPPPPKAGYDGDMVGEARRYADLCRDLATSNDFDVIHAHDWMTFPAAAAIARASGKPMIAHIHSTEFDRSGENIHQGIYDLERQGLHDADRIIAVSHLTQSILEARYAIPAEKVDVIYNGIDHNGKPPAQPDPDKDAIRSDEKIVLFLGRVTMQKGPEYFVRAAKRVLDVMDGVRFVIAGTGDKIRDLIELSAELGIGHRCLFTGFLHGPEVERIYQMASVYVMPSVSEPFGIATLEAISHDVPVIISKTSGVSEVLTHVLKVDFWDTEEMANKIIAVLKHPPLATTLRHHATIEVRQLTWDGAAQKCADLYRQLTTA
ncbi:glycosyltransferase family 4 protein [Mucisphaera calidilacus]|uniref:starch synthase n=1 Tax=Mucisphaera calidilacus TaxID=2527982 RepID=A0A518C024_9BACT|nr:glycosyltransferase family 4 protein [Mucisphaera calidilacus]QDU72570.1 Glycogen synthase [Mucisphaera calidilacus]